MIFINTKGMKQTNKQTNVPVVHFLQHFAEEQAFSYAGMEEWFAWGNEKQ